MKKSLTVLLLFGAVFCTQAAMVWSESTHVGALQSSSAPPINKQRINQLRDLKKVDLKVAGTTIHAWIMDNESKREEGMMFLNPGDVKPNQGMIFVFTQVQPVMNSFWMHNCPAGLDIIYIDGHHKVLNVGDGAPENDAGVKAAGAYSYVLELNRGWSKRHALKAGAKIGIPSSLTTTE